MFAAWTRIRWDEITEAFIHNYAGCQISLVKMLERREGCPPSTSPPTSPSTWTWPLGGTFGSFPDDTGPGKKPWRNNPSPTVGLFNVHSNRRILDLVIHSCFRTNFTGLLGCEGKPDHVPYVRTWELWGLEIHIVVSIKRRMCRDRYCNLRTIFWNLISKPLWMCHPIKLNMRIKKIKNWHNTCTWKCSLYNVVWQGLYSLIKNEWMTNCPLTSRIQPQWWLTASSWVQPPGGRTP